MKLPPALLALRPHQWSKNIFVLAALGGAWGDRSLGSQLDSADVVHTLYAFFAFCLGASAIYLVNDLVDVESDRRHPEKRHRPIASGALSASTAKLEALVCALGAFGLAFAAGGGGYGVAAVVAAYVAMNLAYSLRLKHIVLVDVFCIAAGFLFRVKAGGLAAGAELSHWLLLCTLFLALFLACNKRRAEMVELGEERAKHRSTLREYDLGFLDQLVTVLAACTIVCYTMFTVDEDTIDKIGPGNHLVWSVPFVVFGIARYMLLVHTARGGGNPTRLFLGGDRWFLINGLLWLAVVGVVLGTGF